MGKGVLSEVFLTVGLFWGVIGIVLWVSDISTSIVLVEREAVQSLIIYVIAPALLFIFAAIISSINDVR